MSQVVESQVAYPRPPACSIERLRNGVGLYLEETSVCSACATFDNRKSSVGQRNCPRPFGFGLRDMQCLVLHVLRSGTRYLPSSDGGIEDKWDDFSYLIVCGLE